METEKMVTADKLADINKRLPPHEQLIRVFNPQGKKIREEFHTRKLFDKVLKHQGWIELGNDDISEVLMKNRPRTPAELVLEQENQRLKDEMAALRNGQTTAPMPPAPPPTFALNTTPADYNLDQAIPQILVEISSIERVATLNEMRAAETSGQNRKGVLSAIDNRINEIGN